jgi:hypothetical protein
MKIYLGKGRNYFVDRQSFPVTKDSKDTSTINISKFITDKYNCHVPEHPELLQCITNCAIIGAFAK